MQFNKKPLPLSFIKGIKDRVNTNPDFQRPPVWGRSQKQLLIDTILRGYDVPKLYWRRTSAKPERFDVIDGQQRLRAIWEFYDSGYRLPNVADPIDEEEVANLGYEDLTNDLRLKFDSYPLDVVIVDDTDEDEVREMFLRLQNGTSLKAQEKRNAYPGNMRDFVRSVVKHPFFQRVEFSVKRLAHDQVAAQMVCIELAGGPTNVKNTDLNKMYESNQDFDTNSIEAKSLRRTLDLLAQVFPEKAPELKQFNVVALYCLMSQVQALYVLEQVLPKIHDWFIAFEQLREREESKSDDDANAEWRTYKEKTSHSTDSADSISWRTDFLMRSLLDLFPNLPTKDNERIFTSVQRLAIFRRDNGFCQIKIKCDGTKLSWDSWHCDHKVPWSKGGPTTVDNGQVSCMPCNTSKSDG